MDDELLFKKLLFVVQGLNEINPRAVEIEESNALALAIVSPGTVKYFTKCHCV